jgi:hypothetical protein
MAARPVLGLVCALALWLIAAGCGDADQHSDPAARQRQRLVRAAESALRRYNAQRVKPRAYRGPGVRLRLTGRHRVAFSIGLSCSRHRLRAFPDRPPRLGADGRFSYRERARRSRLAVAGRVRGTRARGRVSLAARGCRVRRSWRAASA